jgi:sulfur-oxidizing protein SoxY
MVEEKFMELTRRTALAIGAAGVAVAGLPLPARATMADLVAQFTGGVTPDEGDVSIIAPEIAENGNAVPVTIEAEGARRLALFAPLNPDVFVAEWEFGPASGRSLAATRIRLAETQGILAVAEMADGRFIQSQVEVRVTIGGCGG